MRLLRAVSSALGVSCALALGAVACGSTTKSSGVTGTGDGGGATGPGAAGTTAGPNLGDLGGSATSGGSSSSSGVDNQCAGTLQEAQRVPLDIYIMLDVSGSMLEPTEGDANVTKWQAVSSALSAFVSDKASEGIGVGLQVFPIGDASAPTSCTDDKACGNYGPCLNRACWPLINGELTGCLATSDCGLTQTCVVLGECAADNTYVCNSEATKTCSDNRGMSLGACTVPPSVCVSAADCRPATYATPAAPIATLPSSKDALLKVIQGSMPDPNGLTPTGPALGGAIQASKTWATAHPDHQVVAVLATDGLPTLKTSGKICAPVTQLADIDAIVSEATAGRTQAPSVSTFVIGVLGPDDTAGPTILGEIATAGSSADAFIVDTSGNVQQEFLDALNQIRAKGLSCDLAIPAPEAGKTLDYDKVNVNFSGDPTLAKVDNAAACDAKKGGWYYDADPPTRIMTCPVTCDAFKSTDMGSVKIELGCKTRVVVK